MISLEVLQDPDFKKKFQRIKSAPLDNVIDKLIESVDTSFLNQCNQLPDPKSLETLNVSRIAMTRLLESFKTTNLSTTDED